jgi:phage terminase large subunit
MYIQTAREANCPADQIRLLLQAGAILQPRQLAAAAAARACDRPNGPTELGYGGARGGGKTHWLLVQIAIDDCQRYPGLKCLLLRKVGKANKENFQDVRRRILRRLPHRYNRQEAVLTFPNGSSIVLGHFQHEGDIDAYLGLEYDVIGVEEATTLSHSKYRAIQTCCRTSKPDWRPRIYSTTNPGGIGHAWYKARFVDQAQHQGSKIILGAPEHQTPKHQTPEHPNTLFIPATIDDNHFVNSDYRNILDRLSGWQKRAWRYGDWDIAAGQFFTNWRRDLHVRSHIDAQPTWRYWCALDYGFTHYTSVHLLARDGDGVIYILDEHAERGWLTERHAPAIKAMLARHNLETRRLYRFVAGADVFAKRMEGGTIAEAYAKLGIRLEPANDDRNAGAGKILSRLLPSTSIAVAAGSSKPCPPSSTIPIVPRTCSKPTPTRKARAETTPTTAPATASWYPSRSPTKSSTHPPWQPAAPNISTN